MFRSVFMFSTVNLYEKGVYLAFLIGTIKVLVSVSTIFSIRATNLKKIGLYYNGMRGAFIEKKTSAFGFLFYLGYMLLIAPVFSWLSVISAAWGLIAWLSNRTSTPESVKLIQYKIGHFDLSKDQLIDLQVELSKILGIDGLVVTGTTADSDSDPFTYIFEEGDWYRDFTVDLRNKTLTFSGHPADYFSQFHSEYKYTFEGEELKAKLINEYSRSLGKEEWTVKDGVVLESDIRMRHEESEHQMPGARTVDEILKELATNVNWHSVESYEVRFFVMKLHPNLFPRPELRRLIRTELERLNKGINNLASEAKKLGLVAKETKAGMIFTLPKEFNGDEAKAKVLFSPQSLSSFGLRMYEIDHCKEIRSKLDHFLLDEKVA